MPIPGKRYRQPWWHQGNRSRVLIVAARAPRAATPLPSRRAWLRIFVVRCSLPCDPPVGGHSCHGGMIPPLYGAFFVKEFARAAHLFPSSVSWFDLKVRFFIPTRASPRSMRAEAVKIGRRTNLAACFALARPYLDGFEHDGTLNAVAMTIRGEPAFGARFNRATTLYPVGPRTRTMMQSCASAAKLRSGGPILPFGVRAKGRRGIPPPRTVIGVPSQAYGQAETVVVPSASFVHCAGRKTTPSGTMPSRMSRHRAISSLRAKATIMGFRVPRAFSVRDRNHFVKALFFWCRRNRHAN